MEQQAFIVDGVRTAVGSFSGGLSSVRPDDMAAHVIRELIARQKKLDSSEIEDVILGCANQAGEDNRNVARMAALLSGLPVSVPGQTVNRLCASGMAAVVDAARAIRLGEGDLYIAGGVESMTRAPYVLSKSEQAFSRNSELFDTSIGWRFVNPAMKAQWGIDSMGETAENVAEKYKISRDDQDRFALWSQQKAAEAQISGRLEREIVGIEVKQGKAAPKIIDRDEFLRPNTTLEALSKLRPAFKKDGSVTAGNASGINDGACAVLLASEKAVKKYNLHPKARVVTSAVCGVEPRIMGIGPVDATKKVLARAGLKMDDLSVIELNEAFAAQSVACTRELGLKDFDPRVNPNGGAIALGHPLGMSGARLVLSAAIELELQSKDYALCTMCVGVGQGMAVILQRV